jgi:hypothetical protein
MKIFQKLLATSLLYLRIFVLFKFIILLIQTSFWPNEYPTSLLTWWVYYMVFDMWMVLMLPTENISDEDED